MQNAFIAVVLHKCDDRKVIELDLRQRRRELTRFGKVAQVRLEIVPQVGKVESDFDLAGAVLQVGALDTSRQSPNDVVVEAEFVASNVAHRFLGQGQAKNPLAFVVFALRFLAVPGVGRGFGAVGLAIRAVHDHFGGRDDLDLVADADRRKLNTGAFGVFEDLVDDCAVLRVFILRFAYGPPPPPSLRPLKKVEGVPGISEP
jgi:hypothetical protein